MICSSFLRIPIASKNHFIRFFTSGIIHNKTVLSKGKLLRNFLDDFLYSQTDGYFNTYDCIGKATSSISFDEMENQAAYRRYQDECYRSSADGWLTPVELFDPFYAETILTWMLSENDKRNISQIKEANFEMGQDIVRKTTDDFHILEIGAGSGTCCISILNALRSKHTKLYNSEKFSYTIVERSTALAEAQRVRLAEHGHSDKCDIYNMSITDWRDPKFQNTSCFVFGLEVLDNMPHDKIVTDESGFFQQASVHINPEFTETRNGRRYIETYEAVDDGWIDLYLDLVSDILIHTPKIQNRRSTWRERYKMIEESAFGLLTQFIPAEPSIEKQIAFVPTTSLQFLNILFKFFPSHSLLLVDFDFLPDVKITGQNAPLVAAKSVRTGGQTRDLNTYLVDLGVADVMFPTNFNVLAQMYQGLASRYHDETEQKTNADDTSRFNPAKLQILKSGEFIQEFAPPATLYATTTQSGYNPMIEDYQNQSVFIATTQ